MEAVGVDAYQMAMDRLLKVDERFQGEQRYVEARKEVQSIERKSQSQHPGIQWPTLSFFLSLLIKNALQGM